MTTAGAVLAISGALGFGVGLAYADWQWGVEHAQVLAGLVTYAPDSPVAIAHAKLWSVTSQIGAVLLSLGVSEIALSKLLSGVLGLVSFQALAAIVFALSRDPVLAVGSVFVIFVSRVFDYGAAYPIAIVGTAHTHGALGLSVAVLAAGLLGMGCYRTGAVLLAFSPAVHAALGGWMLAIVAIAAISAGAPARAAVRSAWKAYAVGASLAAASYAIHWMLAPAVAPIDAVEADRYLRAFVPFWDAHRQAVDVRADGVRLAAGVVVIACAGLVGLRRDLPPPAALLLRVAAIGGALGLALALWAALRPATLPDALLIMMPGRMLNVSALMAGATVIGLAGFVCAWRATLASQVLLLSLAAALVASSRSVLWDLGAGRLWRLDPLAVLAWTSVGLIAAAWWRRGPASRTLRAAIAVTLIGAAAIAAVDAVRAARLRADLFRDRTNDPLFAAAAIGSGPLLTGGELFLIQLRTRRPVLLDGGTLDALPYALESGPAMQRILTDVYGIDLFNPPIEARGGGRVPDTINRRVWESYSVQRWQRIGRDHGLTQVLAPSGWTLRLPAVERSRGLSLYVIPD